MGSPDASGAVAATVRSLWFQAPLNQSSWMWASNPRKTLCWVLSTLQVYPNGSPAHSGAPAAAVKSLCNQATPTGGAYAQSADEAGQFVAPAGLTTPHT